MDPMKPRRQLAAICCVVLASIPAGADSKASKGHGPTPPPWSTVEHAAPSWGNVPGLAEAISDSKGRVGRWWWPKMDHRDGEDTPGFGNRGRVFGKWEKPDPVVTVFDPPLPLEATKVREPEICIFRIPVYDVLFDSDDASLKPEGKAEIDKVINEMLKFKDLTAVCKGHTDEVGPEVYNLELGERRAQAVRNYMIDCGIAPERIVTVTYGERHPSVPNTTSANRALNRRVELETLSD